MNKNENDFQVTLDADDYKRGYLSGYKLERFQTPSGVDGLSFSSGYIEGKGAKQMKRVPKYPI